MENCLAGGDEYRGTEGPLVLERGPATSPLFSAFFEAVTAGRVRAHHDVNGYRQEGFAAVRPQRAPRPAAVRRAGVPAPGHGPAQPDRASAGCSSPGSSSGPRAVGVEYVRNGAASGARAGRSSCAAAPSTRRNCSSCPGSAAGRARAARHRRASRTCRASARTCRTTSRCTSSTAASCRSRCSRRSGGARPWIGANWLFFRSGPGATNHFEGGGFARSNDDVAYPNLMFHFLPIAIRYDGSAPAGGHGYQVHIGPMYSDSRGSVQITSADPQVHPALRFNYLSTPTDRREWVEAIACRAQDPQPARLRRLQRRRAVARARGRDRGADPGLGPPGRRDRAAPVLHAADGHRRAVGRGSGDDAGARPRWAAGSGRLGDAVRHQRQHLRSGDDDRREGGRPDPRQHPAAALGRPLLPPPARRPVQPEAPAPPASATPFRMFAAIMQTGRVPHLDDPRDPRGLRPDAPLLDAWLTSMERAEAGELTPMITPGTSSAAISSGM